MKITRKEIVDRIVKIAGLAPCTTSEGYFTRVQLLELLVMFERKKSNEEETTTTYIQE